MNDLLVVLYDKPASSIKRSNLLGSKILGKTLHNSLIVFVKSHGHHHTSKEGASNSETASSVVGSGIELVPSSSINLAITFC